jgi:hypothetical protein
MPILPAFTKKKALAASFSKHCRDRDEDGDDGVRDAEQGGRHGFEVNDIFFSHNTSHHDLSCLVMLDSDCLTELELP